MPGRVLAGESLVAERPITYSELTAAAYDLEFHGDPASIENARAAYLRGLAGPNENERWLQLDTNLWEGALGKIGQILGVE